MTNVDIGKLYGVCRKFITVWDDPYSEPAAFGPAVEELREVLGPQQDEYVELLESGRQLANQRDDLIAAGADPTELAVPLAPVCTWLDDECSWCGQPFGEHWFKRGQIQRCPDKEPADD